jgi:hypothetical protein
VQFVARYAQGEKTARVKLPGFVDLGEVYYSYCTNSP